MYLESEGEFRPKKLRPHIWILSRWLAFAWHRVIDIGQWEAQWRRLAQYFIWPERHSKHSSAHNGQWRPTIGRCGRSYVRSQWPFTCRRLQPPTAVLPDIFPSLVDYFPMMCFGLNLNTTSSFEVDSKSPERCTVVWQPPKAGQNIQKNGQNIQNRVSTQNNYKKT